MSKAHLHTLDPATGQWRPVVGSSVGAIGGGGGGGDLPPVNSWYYAAASGGIVNTSDVTLAAAPGAGLANYLTDLQLANSDATVGTEVVIKDGSTILFRTFLPPGRPASLTGTMPFGIHFSNPLRASNNTALTAAAITTAAEVYINAQGFVGLSQDQLEAAVSPIVEIFDALGNQLVDSGGLNIVQGNV